MAMSRIAARRFSARALGVVVFAAIAFLASSDAMAAGIMPASPTHAWTFDEGTGTTAYPTFGNQVGELRSGAAWSTDVPIAYADNYSADFLDDYDQVRLPSHYSDTSGSFQFWFRTSEILPGDYLMHTTGTGSKRTYLWTYGDASNIDFGLNGTGAIGHFTRPPDNTWNHLVVVWDDSLLPTNDNITIYVTNGDGQNVYSFKKTLGSGETGQILMSYPGWGSCGFKGQLDELAYWSVPLTADNVAWLHENSVSSIPEPATATLSLLAALALPLIRRRRKRV